MKARAALIISAVLVLVLAAFFLGQRTQMAREKKAPAKKAAQARPAAKKKGAAIPAAAVVKTAKTARIAIVIDDFGYNTSNLAAFFDIKEPLTFSILPNLRHSRDVAEAAKAHGCEVILHMPMESHRKDVVEETDTLKPGQGKKDVAAKLAKAIASVPGLDGVSNHMGSAATEDKALMTDVLSYLKKENLYFFDSLTSEKSVGREVASRVGIRFARRDIFLDNSNNVDAIKIELGDLKKLALKRGYAIAICHDRKNTAIALAAAMPHMAEEGIEFVYLSDMVK